MIPLIDIIRADNKRYAELLDVFLKLADVTVEGPGGTDEGRIRETEPVAPPIDQRVSAKGTGR